MSEITLEKVDQIRERTGITYAEAKEALEVADGDVLEALVYLENKQKGKGTFYNTKEEFVGWIKDVINKGNVTRIKVKKDDRTLIDLPITAGLTVTGLTAVFATPLFTLGLVTAVVTKVTVEITKEDGSVEVVNKYIKGTVDDVKDKITNFGDKFSDIAEDVKGKITDFAEDIKTKMKNNSQNSKDESESNVYKYTVEFKEEDKEEENDKK
ncbi:DUF4342 domain-containing protein [Clostridium sp. 19966]|uniref:DUF4342 domain-containing protein n=1 Tax=Clostridium sp. 19966 TaxID=2768166 RepID=UPI0028DF7591|nr:DUF4342 domain-containing protein [Clostridium sp. 19966]MDT8715324.1 DUF4342 domain-containing protein [Clostridium sp. 19966]